MEPITRKLVFVALGDSLTVGYHSPVLGEECPEPAPYTRFLGAMTQDVLSQKGVVNSSVDYLNRGVIGETTEEMVGRFRSDVLEERPDAVIILGGSNDLGWGIDAVRVARNLAQMVNESVANDIQPISCTVPSVLGFDEGIPPRTRLNELIKRHCMECMTLCVDLFSATSDSIGRLRREYSDDGLHLSSLGYEAMARRIFSDAVSSIIAVRLLDAKRNEEWGTRPS